MDIHSNLEYLCRVCAANTKGKNSVAECVYILKTAGLKDKLDKFLYLKISDNDSLPKVLCKSCFRQVEATASLSKIAKHTQQVFREFLLSNLPKGPSESTNTSSTDFTTSDFLSNKDTSEKSIKEDVSVSQITANTLSQLLPSQIPASVAAMLPPSIMQPLNTTPRKDEVIVNVSVSDPLTRDNQQKMISNSQRRQSLLLESRYTPKSIAQKSSTMASASTVNNQKVVTPKLNATIETGNTTNMGKSGTTPTLNFYPINKTQQSTNKTHQQQQQQLPQSTQITTFSSGGYVIGNINNDKESSKKITLPLAPTADNVLQQKRKNLVKALNNIKANNSGQVSLLKSSQQKQANASSNSAKIPLSEVVNQVAEDELPDKIIIAAPKNKKEPLNLSSKIPAVVTAITNQTNLPNTPATITPMLQQTVDQSSAVTVANFNSTPTKPAFPEDILLGRVIRDMDLLKLILKALKWPVNKQNMELQLQRLKNSKFTDIMSDSNLLQDTDLTQLLGPYLAPVLLAAQALQQQQQQLLNSVALNQNVATVPAYVSPVAPATSPKISALEAAQAEINKSIPYKLPPETSVQLVPATPEEQEALQSPPLPNITTTTATSILKRQKETPTAATEIAPKRQKRAAAQKARDSIVISDEDDIEETVPKSRSRQRSNRNSSNIQIELNSNFMQQFNSLTGANSDEANAALLALLQRQKEALLKDKKVQRRRRNSVSNLITIPTNEFDALINLDDDIVLMEPVTTTSSTDSVSAPSNTQEIEQTQQQNISNPFVIPSVPLITRPIIKRRKTVIHSSRARLDTSLDKESTAISSSAIAANKEKLMEETINQVAKGNLVSDTTDNEVVVAATQQSPSKASKNNESSQIASTEVSVTKAVAPQKKTQNKAALGQQLLEAIGLQKISTKISNTQTETATSSSVTNNLAAMPNNKQSIQQIRSALKKSLKHAQEQQQLRKKELSSSSTNNTIIQDADSTTKPAVKEIVVVEGKANKSDDTSSSMVDVEEQIDKVTLMVRKNDDKEVNEQPTTSEKEEKKEKKSPSTKIQERRRTMPAMGARGARNNAVNNDTKEKSNIEEEKVKKEEETEKTKEVEEDKEKTEKDENETANISSSSGATSSETSATIKEEVATPKRRGRKRLVDKQAEAETAETNENEKEKDKDKEIENKEKDTKSSPALTERSRTFDKTKDEEIENNKNEEVEDATTSNKTSGRPTRQSKQQSKYYKGPEKPPVGRRSLPSRTTRNRKYS